MDIERLRDWQRCVHKERPPAIGIWLATVVLTACAFGFRALGMDSEYEV